LLVGKSNEASLDAKLQPESFVADVSFAARALISQPTVLIVPLLLWCFPIIANAAGRTPHKTPGVLLADLALVLFWLGWAGAERIFFLRHLEKKPVTVEELLGYCVSFFGRFFALAVLLGIVAFGLTLFMMTCDWAPLHAFKFELGLAISMAAVDFVLTFVPSALAFTTRSVRRSLRIGLRMIGRTWPRCGLYVLCPPLALNFVNTIYPMHLTSVRLVVTAGLTVLALLAKGATAAFYLRERPTYGPDGAAHVTAAEEASARLIQA
jgi:hypothetical protein